MLARATLAAFAVAVAAGCGSSGSHSTEPGAPLGPAPPNPLALTRAAGLTPEAHEFFAYHVHAHLDVVVDGSHSPVPAGIGINIKDPGVKRGRAQDGTLVYGYINPPCNQPCISALHTHGQDGVLHTESRRAQPNRLEQFFTEWNVRLDRSCIGPYCRPDDEIAVYIGGDRFTGDPRSIALTNGKEIAIVIGSPPKNIPSAFPR